MLEKNLVFFFLFEGSPTAFYTGDNLRDALRRLVRLLDRPESFAVLKENF